MLNGCWKELSSYADLNGGWLGKQTGEKKFRLRICCQSSSVAELSSSSSMSSNHEPGDVEAYGTYMYKRTTLIIIIFNETCMLLIQRDNNSIIFLSFSNCSLEKRKKTMGMWRNGLVITRKLECLFLIHSQLLIKCCSRSPFTKSKFPIMRKIKRSTIFYIYTSDDELER